VQVRDLSWHHLYGIEDKKSIIVSKQIPQVEGVYSRIIKNAKTSNLSLKLPEIDSRQLLIFSISWSDMSSYFLTKKTPMNFYVLNI
jgi:hypothetical protein